jgi:hypothetical protein
VIGAFGAPCALICTPPSRAFGAGFGTGTFCADEGIATPARDAVTNSASPLRMPRPVDCFVIRYFGPVFEASPRFDGCFIALWTKRGIVFP